MRSTMHTYLSSGRGLATALILVGLGITTAVVACSDVVSPMTDTSGATDAPESSATAPAFPDSSVLTVVEDPPQLEGGLQALQESVTYPEAAKEAGHEGRVIVQFVVGPDGAVHDPTVVRGANERLNQEALRAVKAQTFEPGRQGGNAVPVQMSLPVTFQLGEQEPATGGSPADSSVFMVVEDKPVLKGGMQSLQEAVDYPEVAKDAGVEGRVIVQFVVGRDGRAHDIEIIKGVNEALDQAAVEAVRAQTFEPGRQRGQAVPVRMALPVTFKLSKNSSEAEPTGSAGTPNHGTTTN